MTQVREKKWKYMTLLQTKIRVIEDLALSPIQSRHLVDYQWKKTEHILPCTKCWKQFSQESHLKTHMKFHESQSGSHDCSQCDKTFSNKKYLEVHTKRHEDGDHTCNKCDFEGNSKEALAKHIEIKHTIISEPTCNFCGLKFTFRYQLTNHILGYHASHKPCTNFA